MNPDRSPLPPCFKGIALFTPGGDLIYCIDPSKQSRWHLQLCVTLQEILGLSEPPHFLVPCYTATLDRGLDSESQQLRVYAEAYAPVLRYQTLLNAVFETSELVWQIRQDELCNPMMIATYYDQFPELWENHDLIIQIPLMDSQRDTHSEKEKVFSAQKSHSLMSSNSPLVELPETSGYVLRLFVSGHTAATERTLQNLHQLLEQSMSHPYTLKVIDVFKHPEQAEADQISATPTLIRVWPRPVRRIVGELDNSDKILRLLGASGF